MSRELRNLQSRYQIQIGPKLLLGRGVGLFPRPLECQHTNLVGGIVLRQCDDNLPIWKFGRDILWIPGPITPYAHAQRSAARTTLKSEPVDEQ